jgi:hypothetical protein
VLDGSDQNLYNQSYTWLWNSIPAQRNSTNAFWPLGSGKRWKRINATSVALRYSIFLIVRSQESLIWLEFSFRGHLYIEKMCQRLLWYIVDFLPWQRRGGRRKHGTAKDCQGQLHHIRTESFQASSTVQVNFLGGPPPNVILETSQERDRWYVYCHTSKGLW